MNAIGIILLALFALVPFVILLITFFVSRKRNVFQSAAKLVLTLLAINVTIIITKLSTPSAVNSALMFTFVEEGIIADITNSAFMQNVIALSSALVMPVIFSVVLIPVSIVFTILYIIPKKLLTDEKVEIMLAKKKNKEVSDTVIENSGVEAQQGMSVNSKKWLRVISIALSLLSAILMLSHFALPVSHYSQLAKEVVAFEIIENTEEIEPAIDKVATFPTLQAYRVINRPATYFLEQVRTTSGKTTTVSQLVELAQDAVDDINALSAEEEPTAELFYIAADSLESAPFLDELITSCVKEMCIAWEKGEAFFGVEQLNLGNEALTNLALEFLPNSEKVSTAFRAIGDALNAVEIMEEKGIGEELINEIVVNTAPDEVDLLGTIFSSVDVLGVESEDELGQRLSAALKSVFDGIAGLKRNNEMSDEERTSKLKREAKALTLFYQLITVPTTVNPNEIGVSLAESSIFSDVITELTEKGEISDPLGIGSTITKDIYIGVLDGLKQGGISKSDDLFKSVKALLGK